MTTPHPKTGSTVIVALADHLRANPNKWAKLPTRSKYLDARAHEINSGQRGNLPASEFQATVRADGVYIRYIGHLQPADAPVEQVPAAAPPQAPAPTEAQQLLAGMAALTAAINNLSKHFE